MNEFVVGLCWRLARFGWTAVGCEGGIAERRTQTDTVARRVCGDGDERGGDGICEE